jgi:scyllo-inositol 2-dehydrogenase (NADP+)
MPGFGMVEPIGFGVLGVGRIGLFHCERILSTPGFALAAASSRSGERTAEAQRRFGVKTYGLHEELISDPAVRWIVIATTTDQHYRWALAAIDGGKNLIIEKPMAITHREAQEIYRRADARGVKVLPHHSRRWDRDFLLVRRVIDEGLVGKAYRIESRRTSFSTGWAGWGAQGMANPWRLKKAQGGGMLNDWACHLVDQILVIAGAMPSAVHAWSGGKVWTTEVDDHFWAELDFPDGLSCRVEGSNNHRIPLPRWSVVGAEGTFQVRGEEVDSWSEGELRREYHGIRETRRFDFSGDELTDAFYPALAEALRTSGELPITMEQALSVMRVVEAMRESAASGGSVRIGWPAT